MRAHSQTSGWSLAAQDVFNNVGRTCIEAMAATQGHTQSLHTNALDEALALPTDFSARIARNTQIVLQQESGTTRIADPWGGSFYVERLTQELARKAWAHIQEVEELGGMAKAIEAGIPKLRIEEASAKTQARIDGGLQSVIGVNKYRPENEAPIEVRSVDNSAVRQMQLDKLKRLRAERDPAQLQAALESLTRAADGGNGNLLALAVDAARAKATVGEISAALEKVWGRHRAEIKSISGVFKREVGMTDGVARVQKRVTAFEASEGRRPRILVAKIGQDGHDRGQKVIASAFADLGFDVDIGPLFATPAEAARQAIENDVHILGVSSLAAAHLTLVPELKAELDEAGPRRHHDRGRRRRAAAGLRRADEGRRRGDLPARHGDRRRRREAAHHAEQAARPRQRSGGVATLLHPGRKALLELDPGRVERLGIGILDVVQRLRREFDGDRELDVLRQGQRDLLMGRAVEVVQLHHAVDDEHRGALMVVRLLDRAGKDGNGDDADDVILVKHLVVLRRRQDAVQSRVPCRGIAAIHADRHRPLLAAVESGSPISATR